MPEFLTNYWVEIVLSVVSILFGVFVSYVFYRLQKRDVVSAQQERTRRAVEELLDVIESYVISKQQLSEATIRNLIGASERAHRAELDSICTPISLLQDVTLRLQKSRHLDIAQKAQYATQIDALVSEISRNQHVVPANVKSTLELAALVQGAIHNNEKDKALESMQHLKDALVRLEPTTGLETTTSLRTSQLTEVLAIGLMAIVTAFITLSDIFQLSSFSNFLIVYVAITFFLAIFILGTSSGKRILRMIADVMRRRW